MSYTRRRFLCTSAAGLAAVAAGSALPSFAQEKLSQATIVVGVPPGGATDILARILSGKLRVLAVTGARRSRFLPDVPTMQELGHKEVLFQDWLGMFAPARTPMEYVNRINAGMAAAVRSEQGIAGLTKMGVEQEIVSADRFAAMVKADYERYRSIVETTGFKASLEEQFK